MEDYLKILIMGEITYIPCNSTFMSLIDDLRTSYTKNPTNENLIEGIAVLNVYISNNIKTLQADLRLLRAIVSTNSNVIC